MTLRVGFDVDEHVVQQFAARISGGVLLPGQTGFDAARLVWNGMIDRAPAVIARCAGPDDVRSAVDFARENNLELAVRGGGHSAAGMGVCDGGLLVDLAPMKGIHVDPERRVARADSGLTWGEFDTATQTYGLATTGGVVSTTGIAGLTLGGGIGWLMRSHGMTCDNLISAEIVTADGDVMVASKDEHPDLFWALRGGGGNFGVVTVFEYQLHPVGPTVLGGFLIWPRRMVRDVLRLYRDFTATAPENASAYVGLGTTPDGEPAVLVEAVCHGPIDEGEAVLRPFREFGPPLADLIEPMSYVAAQSMGDAMLPPGNRVYWKSAILNDLDDALLETVIEHTERIPSPLSAVVIEFYGGAASRVGVGDTAYPHRDSLHSINPLAIWTDPTHDEPNIEWARGVFDASHKFSPGGVYANFLGVGDAGDDRVRAAYGSNYDRLAEIKTKYDPANVFHHNVNVKPIELPG